MTPPQSDSPADDLAIDLRSYLERPQAWAHVSKGLQRIALAIVGNERDAEDVVQGAWLEALEHPQYRQSQGWLKRLVRFRALDVLRKRSRDPARLDIELSDVKEDAHGGEPSDMRWKLDAQREVLEAVNSLKEPYLSTVMLRYFDGKTPVEIAAQLDVPVRTIKTRLTRAHEMLRLRLGARYKDQFGNWAPALVAFSGYHGLKTSSLTLPIAGVVVMKKFVLVAVVLVVVALIPFALHLRGDTNEGLTQTEPAEQELAGLEPVAEIDALPAASRVVLSEAKPVPETSEPATFKYAFPRRPESEVGSLAIRVRYADGTPAERVKLGVMPASAPDSFLMSRSVYTDAAGFVELGQLEPGLVGVGSSRIISEDVEVFAGKRTDLELEVRAGIHYQGRVLGPEGQPVAGALIFLADSAGGDTQTQETAVADHLGRYEVRDVRLHHYLSARAEGFGPSLQVEARGGVGNTMDLDLELREEPGTLKGIALSPTGLPVVGAKVRVEVWAESERLGEDPETKWIRKWPLAFELRTDSDGRFESKHVGSGRMRIKARTQTWQPWEEIVELQPGDSKEITVQFEPGNVLIGSVIDQSGDPISNVSIISGKYQDAHYYRLKTNELGVFKVQGLTPGVSPFIFHKKGYDQVDEGVYVDSDAPNQVEVTLIKRPSIRGVVVDESGAPLNRWLVAVESGRGVWSTSAWTDSEGRFDLLSIPAGTTDLIVSTEDYWESGGRYPLVSVLPSEGPLHIVVPESMHPNSSVQMKLLIDGKPAPKETLVKLRTTSPLTHRQVYPEADGTLHLPRLASQEYYIEVSLAGRATLHHRFFLGVAEDLDLGTLELETGGRILVESEGRPVDSSMQIFMLDERGKTLQAIQLSGGEGISEPLPSGRITLRFHPISGSTLFAETTIIAGETTPVRLKIRPATERQLLFSRKNGERMRSRTVVRITDAQDRVHFYADYIQKLQTEDGQLLIELLGLELGTYQIQVQDPEGDSHTSSLRVGTLEFASTGPESIELGW